MTVAVPAGTWNGCEHCPACTLNCGPPLMLKTNDVVPTDASPAFLQTSSHPLVWVSLVKVAVVFAPGDTVTVTEPVLRDGVPTRAEVGTTVIESTTSGAENVSVTV